MMDKGKYTDFRKLAQSKFWSWIVTALIVGGVVLLSLILSYRGAKAGFIPFYIQAGRHADYSADSMYGMLAGVDMDVVEDLIAEEQTGGEGLPDGQPIQEEDRLATLQAHMLTPILTATPRPTNTPALAPGSSTLTQDAASTAAPSTTTYVPVTFATYTPGNTATAAAVQATQTQVVISGPTPTLTMPAINTATLRPGVVPTNTPVPTSTLASIPNPSQTSTIPPGVVPTHTPAPTNTPRPGNVPPVQQTRTAAAQSTTRTNTLVPTHTLTPVPTNTLVPTPTSTQTPAATSTPRPTFTATLTAPVCPPPDTQTVYVSDIKPEDGDTNVPLDTTVRIEFNQVFPRSSLESALRITGRGQIQYATVYRVEHNRSVLEIFINLQPNLEYTVGIKGFLQSSCGMRQGRDVEFTFTTEGN
jgi:hypothetical protein